MQSNELLMCVPDWMPENSVVCAGEDELHGKFRAMLIRQYVDGIDLPSISKDELTEGLNRTLDDFAYIIVQPRVGDEALQIYLRAGKITDEDPTKLRCRILRAVYEALSEEYGCYPIICDNSFMFALRADGGARKRESAAWNELYRGLEDYLASKRMFFTQRLGFIPQIIASEVAKELRDLPRIMHTATFFCDYAFSIYPKKRLATPLLTKEMEKYRNGNLLFKPEKEKKFFECIIEKDFHTARNLMKEIMTGERAQYTVVPIRERMQDRLRWTISMLGLPGGDRAAEIEAIRDKANAAGTCRSMEELFRIIDEFFDAMEKFWGKNGDSRGKKVKMVQEYIAKNYANQDLNVSGICQIFDISPEHLSRTFKKETGVKLIDYIHLTRISRAKELMQEQIGLSEIALRVGYSGEWSLARAFKRFEGVTPREFRVNSGKK